MRGDSETIERAAILFEGIVYDVPRPQRHWHAIRAACESLGATSLPGHEQGFVTSAGRFVRRAAAARIAHRAGQLGSRAQPSMLTSEDLW